MIFLITVSHPLKGIKSFSFRQFSLEAGLDVINYVCGQPDDHLLSAHMIDDERVTSIPVTAFDGRSFSQGIHELEQVWQALLPKTGSARQRIKKARAQGVALVKLALAVESVDQLKEQIQASATRMVQQSQSLTQLDAFLGWALIESVPSRSGLLACYQHQIASLTAQMSQSRVYHAQLTSRLDGMLGLEPAD